MPVVTPTRNSDAEVILGNLSVRFARPSLRFRFQQNDAATSRGGFTWNIADTSTFEFSSRDVTYGTL